MAYFVKKKASNFEILYSPDIDNSKAVLNRDWSMECNVVSQLESISATIPALLLYLVVSGLR
jgi:hypothetical protein